MSAVRPISVKLDPDVQVRMRKLAEAQRRSTHYLMREAISEYVEREEKREAFRQEALAAWSAYQTDGLHLTHSEADDWLAKLEADRDVKPPECHK